MTVTGVELPLPDNPYVLAVLRLFNRPAKNREKCLALQAQARELLTGCTEFFAEEDAVQIEALVEERDSVVQQAKALLARIHAQQTKDSGSRSLQPRLFANLEQARNKLNEYQPINRTVSTLAQIKQSEAEHQTLRKGVADAQQAIELNARTFMGADSQVRSLQQEYRQLQSREELLSKQIEQLKLPVEQRDKPRRSFFWNDPGTGSTFMMSPL